MEKRSLKIIILSLLMCFTSMSYAQSGEVDSFPIFHKWAESNSFKNIDSSLYWWKEARRYAIKVGNEKYEFKSIGAIATLYNFKGQTDLSLELTEKAATRTEDPYFLWQFLTNSASCLIGTDIAKADSLYGVCLDIAFQQNDSSRISTTYSNIGLTQTDMGNYWKGIESYIESSKYHKVPFLISNAHSNAAQLFVRIGNMNRAEEYLFKAKEVLDSVKHKRTAQKLNTTIAFIKYHNGEVEEAYDLLEEATAYFVKKKSNPNLAHVYYTKAKMDIGEEKWGEASLSINKAVDKIKYIRESTASGIYLEQAKVLIELGELAKAEKVLDKSYTDYDIYSHPIIHARYLNLMAELSTKRNDSKAALGYFKRHMKLKDSLANANNLYEINFLESEFKRQQQDDEIASLDLANKMKTERLGLQNKAITIGGLLLLIISLLSIFLYRFSSQIGKKNKIIKKALEEKDILLREIHHRVKNNLQLVSSLLGLQGMTTKDKVVKDAINEGRSRVMSMALIHQDLYNKKELTSVNVKDYLEKLSRELINTYNLREDEIKLKTDISSINLDVETLIPLGLIINELLTNSLKYAFPEGREGVIELKLYEESGGLVFELRDNGVGIQEGDERRNSFGFRMIKSLLRQLEGEMRVENKGGAHFHFTFKEYKKIA